MTDMSERRHRRSIRLKTYDYTQAGAYFVTVCTQDRACLFGDVVDGEMRLHVAGQIVHDEWTRSANMRPRITLDTFAVMPNHIHGIIVLRDSLGTLQRAPTTERFGRPTSDSIPTIIRLFKSVTTKRINELRSTPAAPVWQRNYHEHIIRNEESLTRIRQYIADNPAQWESDRENPVGARCNVPRPEDEAWRA